MNFMNFMPFIILIILKFSNLATLAFDQWRICDDFGASTNQFCCDQCFIEFLKGSSRIFFLSTYAKNCIFLWHHTLNQHIHIDTMYPYCITHFNTMILIPLCENCKFCTYWYQLVWVFIFLLQYMYCHGIQTLKKIKSSYQMGMLKIQYQSNIGFLLCYFFRGQLVMYFQLGFLFSFFRSSNSWSTFGFSGLNI
jgi:hypothetical protein